MKFYNREEELALLGKIEKTSLLIKSNEQNTCLYFFIAKKNEALLCAEFTEEITKNISIKKLKEKSGKLSMQFNGFDCEYRGFSMEDM